MHNFSSVHKQSYASVLLEMDLTVCPTTTTTFVCLKWDERSVLITTLLLLLREFKQYKWKNTVIERIKILKRNFGLSSFKYFELFILVDVI